MSVGSALTCIGQPSPTAVFKNRSAAAVFGRQVLLTAGVGLASYLALGSTIALAGGLFIGWTLASTDLHAKAETIRLRIAQELPEFVQLMAAESASGGKVSPKCSSGLPAVPARPPPGCAAYSIWAQGNRFFSENGQAGFLLAAAQESGHAGLISLAIQLGFVGRGVQVQSLLKSLAQTFADEFHRPGGDTRREAGFEPGRNGGDLLLHAVRDHGAGGGRSAVDQHNRRARVRRSEGTGYDNPAQRILYPARHPDPQCALWCARQSPPDHHQSGGRHAVLEIAAASACNSTGMSSRSRWANTWRILAEDKAGRVQARQVLSHSQYNHRLS